MRFLSETQAIAGSRSVARAQSRCFFVRGWGRALEFGAQSGQLSYCGFWAVLRLPGLEPHSPRRGWGLDVTMGNLGIGVARAIERESQIGQV